MRPHDDHMTSTLDWYSLRYSLPGTTTVHAASDHYGPGVTVCGGRFNPDWTRCPDEAAVDCLHCLREIGSLERWAGLRRAGIDPFLFFSDQIT